MHSSFVAINNSSRGASELINNSSSNAALLTITCSCSPSNNDVIEGFSYENHHIFNDRKEALKFALTNLKSDEILIIFGKGTEEYQEINGTKHFYSDSDIIKEFYEN